MARLSFTVSVAFFATFVSEAAIAKANVAVASNFYETAVALISGFHSTDNPKLNLIPGSTGKHASQIKSGMNVDLMLAADVERPKYLESVGKARQGTRATYAIGRLVLWAPNISLNVGRDRPFEEFAISLKSVALANPRVAPYGQAATQVWESVNPLAVSTKLVFGENIAQAYQFVYTGNADAGFIAKSQSLDLPPENLWDVPASLHAPIEQQMVLLSDNEVARSFYDFILSKQGQAIIRASGYETLND